MYSLQTLAVEYLETDEPTALRLVRDGIVPPPITLDAWLMRWPECVLNDWELAGCPRGKKMDPADFDELRNNLAQEALDRRHAGRRQTK